MHDKTQEKLQNLIIAYTKNLPHKIQNIEDQWNQLLKHWDTNQFRVFHREVHSLCGSAGTYGYHALSKAARELEIFVKSLLNHTELNSEQKSKISLLLEKLKKTSTYGEEINKNEIFKLKSTEINNTVYFLRCDQDLKEMLVKNLMEANYQAREIDSFEQLSQISKKQTPVILLIDMDRLDLNEYQQLTEILKNNKDLFSVFCFSDHTDLLTRLHAVRLGSSAFFHKPVDTFYLMKAINRLSGSLQDQIKVLIVDDSPSLADFYSIILAEAGMKAFSLSQPLELMNAITEFEPDLILMDVYMPECTGLELVELIRQDIVYARLPVIFLSTEEDKFRQLSALSKGGDLFLTKPILPQHLVAAVKSCAKKAVLLNSYIITDSLTGLLNHAHILKHLEIELIRAKRQNIPLCFVMIDIDFFKRINDNFGHLAGDRVLKQVALFLQKQLRKTDLVGRYGGEEFALVLSNQTSEEVFNLCNRLRQSFNEILFVEGGVHFKVSFSAGISSYPELQTTHDLVMKADEALYKAKNSGRNSVVLNKNE